MGNITISHPVVREAQEPSSHSRPHVNQSSRVRSTTSPAASPTTIGEGDLGSHLNDERDRSAIREFSLAYIHTALRHDQVKGDIG